MITSFSIFSLLQKKLAPYFPIFLLGLTYSCLAQQSQSKADSLIPSFDLPLQKLKERPHFLDTKEQRSALKIGSDSLFLYNGHLVLQSDSAYFRLGLSSPIGPSLYNSSPTQRMALINANDQNPLLLLSWHRRNIDRHTRYPSTGEFNCTEIILKQDLQESAYAVISLKHRKVLFLGIVAYRLIETETRNPNGGTKTLKEEDILRARFLEDHKYLQILPPYPQENWEWTFYDYLRPGIYEPKAGAYTLLRG